jgi:uncharacterized FlaG/YvyC family protein
MDIKGLARNLIPFNVNRTKEAPSTRSKTDADNEREGNGQASGEGQKRRALTPEEITDAVKYLEGLPGVKENNLTIRVAATDGITVVYIEDRDGKVVRRIPESELAFLTSNRQKKSGNLLNKAL